jgi:hypothetical protein
MPATPTGDKPQVDNMNIRGTLVFWWWTCKFKKYSS